MEDITKFVKQGVSYYNVICTYTREFVNAEEAYALYDLRLRKDFYLFIKMHGFREAIAYRKQNRYWWDGFNYEKTGPSAETEEGMKRFINDFVFDAIQNDKDNGWDISYWGEVFDLDQVKPLLH